MQTQDIKLFEALDQLRIDCDKDLVRVALKFADKTDYHINYNFEAGVAKIQRGEEATLTSAEKDAVKCFLKTTNAPVTAESPDGYAARIIANVNTSNSSIYRCTNHVQPTSNVVERLFSMCKRTMSDLRKHMGPEVLEASVLLRHNSDLWIRCAPQLVHELMKEETAAKLRDEEAVTLCSELTVADFLEGEADDL